MARKGSGAAAARRRIALNEKFLEDFLEHYEKHGKAALEILFREQPAKYVFLAASLLPKEIDVTHTENNLSDVPDDRIDTLIEQLKRRSNLVDTLRHRVVGSIAEVTSREDSASDPEQT
jgi:hypothetical protein